MGQAPMPCINADGNVRSKKYLPGIKLPENLVAIPDIAEAVKDATALVFVLPHQCQSDRVP